jgi:hypothetical protein
MVKVICDDGRTSICATSISHWCCIVNIHIGKFKMRRNILLRISAIGVLLVSTSLAVSSPAQAQKVATSGTKATAVAAAWPYNSYVIKTRRVDPVSHQNLCLDGTTGPLKTLRCNGSAGQVWQFGEVCSWPIRINLAHPGWAMASYTRSKGSQAILRTITNTCNQSTTLHWQWDAIGNASYAFYHTPAPAVVLDAAPVGDVRNGGIVTVNNYEGFVGTQSWTVTRVG